MPKRPITAVLAALALLLAAPPALAQTATPTPGGPPKDASKAVKEIYKDYRDDGRIDVCAHAREDLQDALDTIEPDFDDDNPDFRVMVETGIQRHDDGRCDDDDDEADATPTPQATTTPEPTATADDGALPPPDDGSTDDGALPPPDDGTLPPEDGTLPPEGEATPEAGVVTPAAPTPAPAAPLSTPSPSPTPAIVTGDNGSLLVPGIVLALALLCGLALALFPVVARRDPRADAAWQEFRFRTRATWTDFTDWLRLGR